MGSKKPEKRSWKISYGVLESRGKVLNFLSVKEWEPRNFDMQCD